MQSGFLWKRNESKTVEPKDGDAQQITVTHQVSSNSSAFPLDIYVGSFVQMKYLIVQFKFALIIQISKLAYVSN